MVTANLVLYFFERNSEKRGSGKGKDMKKAIGVCLLLSGTLLQTKTQFSDVFKNCS